MNPTLTNLTTFLISATRTGFSSPSSNECEPIGKYFPVVTLKSICDIQGSHLSVMTKVHDISRGFHKFPGIIFYFFNVAYTPFDSLISLVGRDSDLKSTETWFSSFERNCPRPLIHWLRFKE